MKISRVLIVSISLSLSCFSMNAGDVEQKQGAMNRGSVVVHEIGTEQKHVYLGGTDSEEPLNLHLKPLSKSWFSYLADVLDPWFMFHNYQQELRAEPADSFVGVPNWWQSLLNVTDPYMYFHDAMWSLERKRN